MARWDEVLESFWDPEEDEPRLPLAGEAVAEAEGALGVRLPSALLELLRRRNGGWVAPRWNAFPTDRPNSWSSGHVAFDELMGIGGREGALSLLDTSYLVEEWGLPSPLVLLTGDGHWWIGLDYRESGPAAEPAVAYFDADRGTDLRLAADFRSFAEGLVPEETFLD